MKKTEIPLEKIVESTLTLVEAMRNAESPTVRELIWLLTTIDGHLRHLPFNESDKMAMLSMYHEVEEMLSKHKKASE